MKYSSPVEVAPGVYQLRPLGVRVTAIFSGDDVVLVDAGWKGSLGSIDAGLRALGSSLERVRLVVLTHSHPDHSGSLRKLVELTSARVAVHRLEADVVSGAEPVPSPFRSSILATITRPFLAPFHGTPVKVDHLLEDGDILPVEEEVRVVHTPGHTPGSICLYVASRRVLIVGDALQYRFRRLTPAARAVTQDPTQARDSLKKLLALDFDVICFSHFPPLLGDARDALRQLLAKTGLY